MEIVFSPIQIIAELLFEIILIIFHFFVRKFPRMSIAFFIGVAAMLFYHGYFIAGVMFAVAACIVLALYVWKSKK